MIISGFFVSHFPALQILIPLFAALFSVITFNKRISWIISLLASISVLIISICCQKYSTEIINYEFGNWKAPYGIEYKIDSLNQPIIIYI